MYFTYSNIFDLVINMTPTIVFLSILAIKKLQLSNLKFDIPQIYVILSFAGMTYGPAKTILNNIVNTSDAKRSMDNVNKLFQEE